MNITPLKLQDIKITGPFWGRYMDIIKKDLIPYQWEVMNDRADDAPKSHCIANFEIAAGLKDGDFYGFIFQDSDLYKWLEAVAYALATTPDPALEAIADDAINLIGKCQSDNGYVNTYFTIKRPDKRWKNLVQGHEMYCAGHMIEAAVAYFDATGKRAFLDIAIKFADHIDNTFGPDDGKIPGYPGHQEIELALCKLYKTTDDKRYLNLAAYFIKQRGKAPNYFGVERLNPDYFAVFGDPGEKPDWTYEQSHQVPQDQRTATGHAVRAVYMYSAMADIARELGDAELLHACDALYENIVQKQMYVTGAVGAAAGGERFTTDYDLPNDLIYGETCASIGLMMFMRRMHQVHGTAEYADIMERALYNTVLAGVSLTGKNYFYVNPLEIDPHRTKNHPALRHVLPVRPKWFSCACCPANVARTLSGLGLYAYARSETNLYVNLYCEGEAVDGARKITVQTAYPFGDAAIITATGGQYTLMLKSPSTAPIKSITIDGQAAAPKITNGYVCLNQDWHGQIIHIVFDMTPTFVYTHTAVQNNTGKAAIMKGPLVYCAESIDNSAQLGGYFIDDTQVPARVKMPEGLLENASALKVSAIKYTAPSGTLYSSVKPNREPAELTLIPYFLWANRGENEMRVFINTQG